MSHPQDSPQLGWLQVQILFLLWDIEMYGLEIARILSLRGVKVGANQLYPALRRLEEKGAIESHQIVRVGTTRIYYHTTEKGKQLAIHQYLDFGELIQEVAIGKLEFVVEGLSKKIRLDKHTNIIDLSGRFYDLFIKHVSTRVCVGGRYNVYAPSEEDAEIYQHRAEYHKLDNVRITREINDNTLDLPDNSIDVGLSYFNIRTRDRLWRLRELKRLLKPEGVAVFVDWHQPKENIRMEIMASIFPGSIGVEPKTFETWLNEVGLRLIDMTEERGLLYMKAGRS